MERLIQMTNVKNKNEFATKSVKQKPRPCPMCKQISTAEYFPFCSKNCKEVDLNRWLSGSYTIPVVEETVDED